MRGLRRVYGRLSTLNLEFQSLQAGAVAAGKESQVNSGSVLLVEDDDTLVHSIVRNLAVRGYETRAAGTVTDGVLLLAEECPALLLLDVDLPDGSGWEVLRALRAGPCHDTPVIVVSALRANPRLVGELHCLAVLEKPFPMESLLRLVREHIGDAVTEEKHV